MGSFPMKVGVIIINSDIIILLHFGTSAIDEPHGCTPHFNTGINLLPFPTGHYIWLLDHCIIQSTAVPLADDTVKLT